MTVEDAQALSRKISADRGALPAERETAHQL